MRNRARKKSRFWKETGWGILSLFLDDDEGNTRAISLIYRNRGIGEASLIDATRRKGEEHFKPGEEGSVNFFYGAEGMQYAVKEFRRQMYGMQLLESWQLMLETRNLKELDYVAAENSDEETSGIEFLISDNPSLSDLRDYYSALEEETRKNYGKIIDIADKRKKRISL